MARGGARVNSGPPPDPNALRRERPADRDGWTALPAEGYAGDIPDWPLTPDLTTSAMHAVTLEQVARLETQIAECTNRRRLPSLMKKLTAAQTQASVLRQQMDAQLRLEAELWTQLWRTPQAAAWAKLVWPRDVAAYARHKVRGELGSMDDAKEARQWSDRLGLNPSAMLRNRWRIADAPAAAPARSKTARRASSTRSRLRVVPGAHDGG